MGEDFPDDFRIFDKSGALGLIADYASKSCIYLIIFILLTTGSIGKALKVPTTFVWYSIVKTEAYGWKRDKKIRSCHPVAFFHIHPDTVFLNNQDKFRD